jgi:hypothetical protein
MFATVKRKTWLLCLRKYGGRRVDRNSFCEALVDVKLEGRISSAALKGVCQELYKIQGKGISEGASYLRSEKTGIFSTFV